MRIYKVHCKTCAVSRSRRGACRCCCRWGSHLYRLRISESANLANVLAQRVHVFDLARLTEEPGRDQEESQTKLSEKDGNLCTHTHICKNCKLAHLQSPLQDLRCRAEPPRGPPLLLRMGSTAPGVAGTGLQRRRGWSQTAPGVAGSGLRRRREWPTLASNGAGSGREWSQTAPGWSQTAPGVVSNGPGLVSDGPGVASNGAGSGRIRAGSGLKRAETSFKRRWDWSRTVPGVVSDAPGLVSNGAGSGLKRRRGWSQMAPGVSQTGRDWSQTAPGVVSSGAGSCFKRAGAGLKRRREWSQAGRDW